MSQESVTEEVTAELGDYLRNALQLRQVIEDFPDPNQSLSYPALSLSIIGADYQPETPYIHNQPSASNHKSDVKYVVGQYNWTIRLDFWERSKEERHDLYERFFQAFSPNLPRHGLSLTLKNYHDIICSYTQTNFSLGDSEEASQRREWRAQVDIVANCRAVLTKREYIVTQEPQLTLETVDQSQESLED